MKKLFAPITLISALLLCALDVAAQEVLADLGSVSKKEERKTRRPRYLATRQIADLKNGALLVRLQTRKNSVEALRKAGQHDRADVVEAMQRAKNRRIVKAFQEEFSFCPSYFFFSDGSEKVKNGDLNEVEFLNADLEVDTSIVFDHATFLTAEFGHITQDTAQYFSNYRTKVNDDWSVQRVPAYYGGTNMGFGGLIIKSDQIIQLTKPFPYYVRTYNTLRSIDRSVIRMNKKLIRYHARRH